MLSVSSSAGWIQTVLLMMSACARGGWREWVASPPWKKLVMCGWKQRRQTATCLRIRSHVTIIRLRLFTTACSAGFCLSSWRSFRLLENWCLMMFVLLYFIVFYSVFVEVACSRIVLVWDARGNAPCAYIIIAALWLIGIHWGSSMNARSNTLGTHSLAFLTGTCTTRTSMQSFTSTTRRTQPRTWCQLRGAHLESAMCVLSSLAMRCLLRYCRLIDYHDWVYSGLYWIILVLVSSIYSIIAHDNAWYTVLAGLLHSWFFYFQGW